MSIADTVFKKMCNDILTNGVVTECSRAVWKDTGELATTIKKFGVVNRYNLQEEFPAITLRKTAIKSAVDELLWIWKLKSNDVSLLSSHIWDEWADDNSTIGKAYGYQIGKRYIHHSIDVSDEKSLCELNIGKYNGQYPSILYRKNRHNNRLTYNVYMDQIDSIIWDLRHNPYSRRIMTNIYNFSDLHEMNLYPCAYSMTFNVTKNKDGKNVLNAILNQRSQDVLVANNWNVVQYSILLMMIAQVCDMIPGELVHVIADCHIYDRHIPLVQELIKRTSYPAPIVKLNPDIKNFYDFTTKDVIVENYVTGEQIKNIPVAI